MPVSSKPNLIDQVDDLVEFQDSPLSGKEPAPRKGKEPPKRKGTQPVFVDIVDEVIEWVDG